MSPLPLFSLTGIALFCLGLYAVIVRTHLLHRILALNVMSSGVALVLVDLARRAGPAPDPIPHALVLTGIVVTVSFTGFALALMTRRQAEARRPGSGDADVDV